VTTIDVGVCFEGVFDPLADEVFDPRHYRYNHVLEYIWGAGWRLHKAGDPAAEDWVAAKALMVLAGDSDRAAADIARAKLAVRVTAPADGR
jgi:hypothetical protein